MAMLLIIEPLPFIVGTISMRICSHTFSFVIYPLAFIDIAISVNKFSLSVGFIITPLTLIAATIRPELSAHSISHAVEPLSSVRCTISQSEWTLGHASKLISLLIGRHLRYTFSEHSTSIICSSSYNS